MAFLLSDDGAVQTWQGDNGQQYQVASQFAPPGLGGMGAPPPVAATPAAPPPAGIQPAELPAPIVSEPPPAAAPIAPVPVAEPVPAPVAEEPPLEMPVDVIEPPSILPTGPLNTPTQVAAGVNETAQARADSARRVGQEQVAAGQDIVNSGLDADYRVQELEKQRAVELQQRQADEAVLGEKHQKLVDRYANFKVDPNRGMSSDRQAMAWIGAALAGLGQVIAGKDPSQNPVIPMIFAQMDRRVQLQMAERDALGVSIGQSKDGIADFRGVTKTRLGEYDLRMGAELERHAKLVDRVKTRLGSVEQQEAATQLAQTLRAEAIARTGSATKAEADQRSAARQAAAAAVARQAKATEDQRRWEADKGFRLNPQTGRYEVDPSMQDPTKALETQGKVLDNEKKARELSGDVPDDARTTLAREKDTAARSLNGFDGRPLLRTVVEQGPDGKQVKRQVPVMASDDTAATYLKTAGAAVDKLTRASDLIKQLREEHGGNLKLLRSEEAQQISSLVKDIDLNNLVARNMGVPTGKDMEIVEGLRGGVDVGAFIGDPTVGIEAMAERAIENYNADLRQKSDYFSGADAVPIKPPRSAAAKAAEQRPDERVATFTKGDPSVAGDKGAIAKDAEMRLAAVKTFLKRDKPSPEAIDAARRQVAADTLMPPSTKAQVLATLQEALDKLNAPDAKTLRDLERDAYPGNAFPLLEGPRFGLPGVK